MTINNNSVEQINIALLDLEKKFSTIKDNKSVIDSLRDSINTIKASLNETKAGLTSGATYDINITGNATTATTATTAGSAVSAESAERATTATTAGSAVSAESAERASKDGNGNIITSTYATKNELAKKSIVPVGVIYPFGGSNEKVPDGYLPCDGRAVSRTEYSALFNVIGTSFGNGDNVSTFNVPDFRGRFLEGANGNLGNRIEAGLPNITGEFGAQGSVDVVNLGTGAFRVTQTGKIDGGMSSTSRYSLKQSFDASRSSPIYGKSSTVQPPAVCVNYIIKY